MFRRVIKFSFFHLGGKYNVGSMFIFSATTGEFEKMKVDSKFYGGVFGSKVCAPDSHYVLGARSADGNEFVPGASYYLFPLF